MKDEKLKIGAVSIKMMPEASDNGSQPYSRASRHREMAGMTDTHT